MFRRLLFEFIIGFLERDTMQTVVRETLTQEQRDGLLSQLWQNAAFRQYIAERDGKLIYSLAGGAGMLPEPRDKYLLQLGQRVEILLLADAAKKAEARRQAYHAKQRETEQKALEKKDGPSSFTSSA